MSNFKSPDMKKKLFSFILLLMAVTTFAQKQLSKDYSYTVSEPYKVFDADEKLYFAKDGELMTVKIDKRDVLIQKFRNDSEKPAFTGEKLYEDFPKNVQYEDVLEFNDKFYFFYSSWDGGDVEKEQLFAREINFKTGEFVGEGKLLFKVNGKITGSPLGSISLGFFTPAISIGVQDKFGFLISHDRKQMLIQYRKKPEVKSDVKSYDVIGMNAFEGDLKMVYSNEVKMPYTERRMDNLDYSIDKEGNAYILAKVYHDDSNDDKKSRRDKEANYHIELLRIKAGSKEIVKTKIEIKDKFINEIWLFESPENYMVCAGFYNKGKKADNADGIMVFKVKKEGDVYDKFIHEIPVEVLNDYVKEKTKKKNIKKDGEEDGVEFKNLVLRDLLVGDDGSIVLTGEQYFSELRSMGRSSYWVYHYNDILITKIDNKGGLAWMKKLPKRQAGTKGQGGMSFKHIAANDSHYVLFLDNVKNYELPLDKIPALHTDGKGGYFTSYKISDIDGSATNSSVFNVRDVEDMTIYQFGIGRIVQSSEDEFIVEVYKKKKEDVMIKIKIK